MNYERLKITRNDKEHNVEDQTNRIRTLNLVHLLKMI